MDSRYDMLLLRYYTSRSQKQRVPKSLKVFWKFLWANIVFTCFHMFSHVFTCFHMFSHVFTCFHMFSQNLAKSALTRQAIDLRPCPCKNAEVNMHFHTHHKLHLFLSCGTEDCWVFKKMMRDKRRSRIGWWVSSRTLFANFWSTEPLQQSELSDGLSSLSMMDFSSSHSKSLPDERIRKDPKGSFWAFLCLSYAFLLISAGAIRLHSFQGLQAKSVCGIHTVFGIVCSKLYVLHLIWFLLWLLPDDNCLHLFALVCGIGASVLSSSWILAGLPWAYVNPLLILYCASVGPLLSLCARCYGNQEAEHSLVLLEHLLGLAEPDRRLRCRRIFVYLIRFIQAIDLPIHLSIHQIKADLISSRLIQSIW